MSLVTREGKGSPLTHEEMDENLEGLADGTLIADGSITTAHIEADAITSAKLADGNVTLAKIQDLSGNVVVGRGNGTGVPEQLSVTASARALLDDATFANMRVTLDVPSNAEAVLDTLFTTTGDMVYASAANTPARLAVGSNGSVLAVVAGLPAYAPVGVPPGTILDFAGTSAPTGYLNCDGSNQSRVTYAALFAAIGTTWGVGDGSTTFTLPDFRRRTAVGSGGSGTAALGNSVGNTGGSETQYNDSTTVPALSINRTGTNVGGTDFVQNVAYSGNGANYSILQPSAVTLKIIKI